MTLRRLSVAAVVVTYLHLVFGGIVRISGSGMGCGDHWPKCYGYWFPPLSRPDLIVEVSHRYLASILVFAVSSMALVAFRHRTEAGIGGKSGVLRSSLGAVAAVFAAVILGGVTVKMGNAPWATVAHWLVRNGARSLVLLGRQTPPPRDAWTTVAPGTRAAQQIAAIQQLERQGAAVAYASVDVADAAALGRFLLERHSDAPPIRGVFHAAGVGRAETLLTAAVDGVPFQLHLQRLDAVFVLETVGDIVLHL